MKKFNKFDDKFNIIGSQIKAIRKQEKITQEDLCARMQVMGYQISRSDISKIENCNKFIADFEVLGFAKALKRSILDLYAIPEEKDNETKFDSEKILYKYNRM